MALVYEKQKIKLNYKEDKPEVYRIKPVKQQPVSFEDLLSEVSNSCGVNRSQTKAVIEALIDRMTVFMNYGMLVKLGDFGSFKPTFNATTGATADAVSADNVTRKKIQFFPGKRFKQMLSGMSVTSMDTYDDEGEEVLPEEPGGGGGQGGGGGEDGGGEFG